MDNTDKKVKVIKYEPLTFACVGCDQQFSAADKTLDQLAQEVSEHISREHPRQHPRAQQRARKPMGFVVFPPADSHG